MAQLGRAPAWGAGGRWFKSSRADQFFLGPYRTYGRKARDQVIHLIEVYLETGLIL